MSTWFARRVLDLVGTLADIYYTRKYGVMARRLGRTGAQPSHQRGFIIIQIDGLSYDHLVTAIDEGYMPYVSQLMGEGNLTVSPWYCGIPSTTPAVQAGIMFGDRFDIPGFRWYEKERRRTISAKRPDQLQTVRERVSQSQPGILAGGSCYVSMFDGDADLALFTLSSLSSRRFFESVRGMGLFLLFLLSPFRILRLLGLSAVNYLAGLGSRLVALIRPSVFNPFDVISPLVHAVSDALLTEVQTFGVMLDIYRCVPAIYANYNSYDEAAHQMGPDSRAAFRTLRDVDKRLRQIDRMRAHYRRQAYDLYILSDHGNSPAVPFRWLNKASLGQHIAAQVGEEISVTELAGAHVHSAEKMHYLLEEWEGLENHLSPRLSRILAAMRRYVNQRTFPDQEELNYDLEQHQDVIVSVSGPLAHVYFNISPRPLDLIEVILLYPHLVDNLLATPGIGALIGRARESTIMLGGGGSLLITDGNRKTVRPPNPLKSFGNNSYALKQLHQLTHFPHAGDLIILGGTESNGKIVGFEDQVATHGGLGGPQDRPFVAWPSERPLVPETLKDAQDLYHYFARHYRNYPPREKPGDVTRGLRPTEEELMCANLRQ